MENADVFLGLHDFLERMRQPSASDFVKSIKSFIVSFSNNAPDPERDSAQVQEFLAKMEMAFRAHPLWAGCSEEELDSAGEGLEKYVMTKLFTRVFASLPDDVRVDEQLSEKMSLIQQFVRPENLDIKPTFQNETLWLLAQKELQKINMYKAPRDKLVCILNCCKVINNLLFNASVASKDNPPGADEFLPVLIFVTIKGLITTKLHDFVTTALRLDPTYIMQANPPQLHSNLLYIQRYRRQSRLVGEQAYFFTNMLSAESFITNIDAKLLSMEESEYEKNMEFARALLFGLSSDSDSQSSRSNQNSGNNPEAELKSRERDTAIQTEVSETKYGSNDVYAKDESLIMKIPSLSDIENRGAAKLLKEDSVSQVFREFPYLFANVGDLTVSDVEDLLNNYKQVVFKYVCLSKGLGVATPSLPPSSYQAHVQPVQEHDTAVEQNDELQKQIGTMNSSSTVSHEYETKLVQDETMVPQEEGRTQSMSAKEHVLQH